MRTANPFDRANGALCRDSLIELTTVTADAVHGQAFWRAIDALREAGPDADRAALADQCRALAGAWTLTTAELGIDLTALALDRLARQNQHPEVVSHE